MPNPIAHPLRQQRSRQRGAQTPVGTIYAGRPTMLGNPFMVARFGHARAVKLHRAWLLGDLSFNTLRRIGFDECEIHALDRLRDRVLLRLPELASRQLQCWCALSNRWCHVETLLGLANSDIARRRLTARGIS